MSVQKYTICLLKEGIDSFELALDADKEVDPHPLRGNVGITGTLFVGRQSRSTPDWVPLLNPYLQAPVKGAYSASISSVLLVPYEQRMFAVCFGHGKSLLAPSSWVRDFGLKVTLNRVDPKKLRSIDTKTYEDLVVSMRKQTSRSSKVESFQLDVARDLVRGVTGDVQDTTFFKRLTGSDSLSLTTELPFPDFGDLLDELLVAYQDTAYKANFEWIDNVKEVDAQLTQQLDDQLVEAIRNGAIDRMHLAPTDVIGWEEIRGFNYTGGPRNLSYQELALEDYVAILGDGRNDLSVQRLKNHKVRVLYDGSEEFRESWSVYECIVWENELDGKKYILFDGRWFEVEPAYATRVADFVSSISTNSIVLPTAALGDDEAEYNQGVATGNANDFALFDRVPFRPAGAASNIEFCDLMSRAGHFIHVKKRSSSATLSHLFAQGSVSGDIFVQDSAVRQAIRTNLQNAGRNAHASLIPDQRPITANYEIVYAILAKNGNQWPPPLPFFSAVNLMHHANRIRNLGFKVSLQHVRQV